MGPEGSLPWTVDLHAGQMRNIADHCLSTFLVQPPQNYLIYFD
jgi:hypothetical protein